MSRIITIELPQDEPETEAVLRAIAEDPHCLTTQLVWDTEANMSFSSTYQEAPFVPPVYRVPYGSYTIPVGEVDYINVHYYGVSGYMAVGNGIACHEILTLIGKKEQIETYIRKCIAEQAPEKADHIPCFIMEAYSWKFLSYLPKRDPDTVFHPERDAIYDDLQDFQTSESEYNRHGLSYKRNYLFYGPPGTGKTSMMCALASKFEAALYIIQMHPGITDAVFMRLISKVPSGSIMVLEDMDTLFGTHVTESANRISFSSVLNTLDGIATKSGMITVMTTNHRDRLDSALLRPGRIDKMIEFPYATERQIRDVFRSYFGEECREQEDRLVNASGSGNVSMAALQKLLFRYRNNLDDFTNNIGDLEVLREQYSQEWYR